MNSLMKHIKHTLPAALTALALALAAGSADAQITNGNFAAGLAGWTTAGDASVSHGAWLWLTTASATYADDVDAGLDAAGARNVSGNDPVAAGSELEAFVGIAPGALDDPANGIWTYEGSAASQTFTAAAGTRLTFQWDLGTLDQRSGDLTVADIAWVIVDGQVIALANSQDATTPATDGGDLTHTGWTDFSWTLATDGAHTVSFAIADVGDYIDTSTLAVTDVSLAGAVPESSSLALMAAGLGLVGLARRRRAA